MEGGSRVIGAARSEHTADEYRERVADAIREFNTSTECEEGTLESFLKQVDYVHVDATGETGWQELADMMKPGKIRAY